MGCSRSEPAPHVLLTRPAHAGGRVSTALVDLTGGIGDVVTWGNKGRGGGGTDAAGLWTKMLALHREGHLLGAGSTSGSDR
jgi:hypothetical protein